MSKTSRVFILTFLFLSAASLALAEDAPLANKGIDFQHIYVGVGTIFDLNGTEPLFIAQAIVNFTVPAESPNTVHVRAQVTSDDADVRAFLGDVRAVQVFGQNIDRDGNTFSTSTLTGTGLPPDDIPVTVENFVFRLRATQCLGQGGMDYVDRGFRVEFSSMICQPPTQFTACFPVLATKGGIIDPEPCDPDPDTQDLVFFRGTGGAFGDATNWEPQRVPSGNDTAVFDRDYPDPVLFGTHSTRRMQVERESVFLRGGGTLDLTESSLTPGLRSLEVGINEVAVLNIENLRLNTIHSLIGSEANARGVVTLRGPSALWTNVGRLSVGFSGLILDESVLALEAGAELFSAESRIGDDIGSIGRVIVRAESDLPPLKKQVPASSLWTTGNLAVGFDGIGNLEIIDSEVVSDSVSIGESILGIGGVGVMGDQGMARWIFDHLTVGNEGDGSFFVTQVDNSVSGNSMELGSLPDSCGAVDILDESRIELAGELAVGVGSEALLRVRGNANLRSGTSTIGVGPTGTGVGEVIIGSTDPNDVTLWIANDLTIGSVDPQGEPFGLGTLTFNDGFISVMTNVTVAEGSAIQGSGFVNGNVVNNGGILAPGGDAFSIEVACGFEDPDPGAKQVAQFGSLEIDGNLIMTGGMLDFNAAGMDAGQFDQLVVTGDAFLADPVIHLTFEDGYLPTTGDTAPLLMVLRTLEMSNPTLEFESIADGFQAQVTNVNGVLMFEALNNAQALPQPGVGCGAGATGGNSTTMFPLLLVATLLVLFRKRGGLPNS